MSRTKDTLCGYPGCFLETISEMLKRFKVDTFSYVLMSKGSTALF